MFLLYFVYFLPLCLHISCCRKGNTFYFKENMILFHFTLLFCSDNEEIHEILYSFIHFRVLHTLNSSSSTCEGFSFFWGGRDCVLVFFVAAIKYFFCWLLFFLPTIKLSMTIWRTNILCVGGQTKVTLTILPTGRVKKVPPVLLPVLQ